MDIDDYKIVNSPIKWAGGKSRFRKRIVSLLPEHTCYVEPFCGAAWVLFAKPPSQVEVINDINSELTTFFKVLKTHPQEFIESFEFELVSRQQFTEFANMSNDQIKELSEIERAHRFFYLIMAAWGGELNYPRMQISITDGGHGNRLFGAIEHIKERVMPVYQRLKTVIIENLDWTKMFSTYDSPTTVFYVDPPYPQNGVNYLHNMRSWEDHKRLADVLAHTQGRWILSSYDNEEVRKFYSDFNIIPVQAASGMKAKKGGKERVINKEVFILNYEAVLAYETENEIEVDTEKLDNKPQPPTLPGIL